MSQYDPAIATVFDFLPRLETTVPKITYGLSNGDAYSAEEQLVNDGLCNSTRLSHSMFLTIFIVECASGMDANCVDEVELRACV